MNQDKREKLIAALIQRPQKFDLKLEELKKEASRIGQLDDWLWYEILCSMSTWGNSKGYTGLMLNAPRLNRVGYKNLLKLSVDERLEVINEVLKEAGVRMYPSKALKLSNNMEKIESLGGLIKVQKHILELKNKEEKINYVMEFEGIGIAYSRNIFMDMHHPDFINSIKIDSRLKNICIRLGIESCSYLENERDFIQIAKDAKITPWELDRLLYNNIDYFIYALN